MGLFGKSKFKRKVDAYGILERYFARYAPLHEIDIDPKRDAYELVEEACQEAPSLLKSKLHRVSLSAAVVAYAMTTSYRNEAFDGASFFLYCLGQMLIDIESDAHNFRLSVNDVDVLRSCSESYKEVAQRLDDGTDLSQ